MSVYMGNNKAASGSGEEEQKAEAWFNSHDNARGVKVYADEQDKQRIKKEMFKNISAEIDGARVRTLRTTILRVAAVLVLISSVGLFLFKYTDNTPAGSQSLTWETYRANGNSNTTVVLADSSTVILKPGAAIAIAPNFNQQGRTTKLLNGEAFFEVTPNPQKPFVVQSGEMSVKVLGTAFTVEDDASAGRKLVSVSHGRVQVSNQSAVLSQLTKGQRLVYNHQNFTIDRVPLSMVGLWSKQAIELDNASFTELSEVFRIFYGKELGANDRLISDAQFTLSIDRKLPASATLNIIAKTHQINFYEKDGKIVLTKQK